MIHWFGLLVPVLASRLTVHLSELSGPYAQVLIGDQLVNVALSFDPLEPSFLYSRGVCPPFVESCFEPDMSDSYSILDEGSFGDTFIGWGGDVLAEDTLVGSGGWSRRIEFFLVTDLEKGNSVKYRDVAGRLSLVHEDSLVSFERSGEAVVMEISDEIRQRGISWTAGQDWTFTADVSIWEADNTMRDVAVRFDPTEDGIIVPEHFRNDIERLTGGSTDTLVDCDADFMIVIASDGLDVMAIQSHRLLQTEGSMCRLKIKFGDQREMKIGFELVNMVNRVVVSRFGELGFDQFENDDVVPGRGLPIKRLIPMFEFPILVHGEEQTDLIFPILHEDSIGGLVLISGEPDRTLIAPGKSELRWTFMKVNWNGERLIPTISGRHVLTGAGMDGAGWRFFLKTPEIGGNSVTIDIEESPRTVQVIVRPVGISGTRIEHLELPASESAVAEAGCAICFAEITMGQKAQMVQECGHRFHFACVKEWFETAVTASCPICRHEVETRAETTDTQLNHLLGHMFL